MDTKTTNGRMEVRGLVGQSVLSGPSIYLPKPNITSRTVKAVVILLLLQQEASIEANIGLIFRLIDVLSPSTHALENEEIVQDRNY